MIMSLYRDADGQPARACYVSLRRRGGRVSEEFNRLRVLWPDHLGLARGKYVPASLADNGVRHCTGLWALGYDRQMTPETPGSHWNDGLPDLDATYDLDAIRPGWEPGTKVV